MNVNDVEFGLATSLVYDEASWHRELRFAIMRKHCRSDAFVLCHHEGITNQQARHSACINWCQDLVGTLGVSMFTDSFGRQADPQLCAIRTGEQPAIGCN